MYKIALFLKSFINAIDDISFPQHSFVLHRHKFILHPCLSSMGELNTLAEQILKESLLDVSSVSKDLSIERTFGNTIHTLLSLSSMFSPVRQNVITSPESL